MCVLTKVFHEKDGNLDFLKGKTIGIIGYGNQGRAQALNLRDSDQVVIIGNRDDIYKERAILDGFETYTISEATKKSDILFLLISDEIMTDVLKKEIKPYLEKKHKLVFASGYTIAFDLLKTPSFVDVLLIAPRMIGVGVREKYLTNEGFYSFISIHNDASGKTQETLLALCKALGTLKKGAIEVTFKQEAVLDLFNEQAFGPAFGQVLLNSIYTLIDAGYPPEAVLVEMYMSEEMAYTYEKMSKIGLVKQTNLHSNTSQYGAMSRGIKYQKLPFKRIMKKILENIESGSFAKEWDSKITKAKYKIIKFFAMKTKINRLEKMVRENLKLKEFDFEELSKPAAKDILQELESIKEEIKAFEDFFYEY